MPLSNELVLGFRPVDLGPLCARYGIPFDPAGLDDNDAIENFKPTAEALAEAMSDDLRQAHRALLSGYFGTSVKEDEHGYFDLVTPAGARKFSVFRAEPYIGEAYEFWYAPENSFFGVALASRYFPVWLDWREEHGTDGCFVLDAELSALVEEARTAIAKHIPEFAGAIIALEPVFY
jgi:hypothetical protein